MTSRSPRGDTGEKEATPKRQPARTRSVPAEPKRRTASSDRPSVVSERATAAGLKIQLAKKEQEQFRHAEMFDSEQRADRDALRESERKLEREAEQYTEFHAQSARRASVLTQKLQLSEGSQSVWEAECASMRGAARREESEVRAAGRQADARRVNEVKELTSELLSSQYEAARAQEELRGESRAGVSRTEYDSELRESQRETARLRDELREASRKASARDEATEMPQQELHAAPRDDAGELRSEAVRPVQGGAWHAGGLLGSIATTRSEWVSTGSSVDLTRGVVHEEPATERLPACSPEEAEGFLVNCVKGAENSIQASFESCTFSLVGAVVDAARRMVDVRVVTTQAIFDEYRSVFEAVIAANGEVRVWQSREATISTSILVDGERLSLGSGPDLFDEALVQEVGQAFIDMFAVSMRMGASGGARTERNPTVSSTVERYTMATPREVRPSFGAAGPPLRAFPPLNYEQPSRSFPTPGMEDLPPTDPVILPPLPPRGMRTGKTSGRRPPRGSRWCSGELSDLPRLGRASSTRG